MLFKLKPEFKILWLAALRSGEYQQTRDHLRDDTGFCCLGVACDIAVNNSLINGEWQNAMDLHEGFVFATPGNGYVSLPPKEMKLLMFGEDIDNTEAYATSAVLTSSGVVADSLPQLNDEGLTFLQIADIIEKEF